MKKMMFVMLMVGVLTAPSIAMSFSEFPNVCSQMLNETDMVNCSAQFDASLKGRKVAGTGTVVAVSEDQETIKVRSNSCDGIYMDLKCSKETRQFAVGETVEFVGCCSNWSRQADTDGSYIQFVFDDAVVH